MEMDTLSLSLSLFLLLCLSLGSLHTTHQPTTTTEDEEEEEQEQEQQGAMSDARDQAGADGGEEEEEQGWGAGSPVQSPPPSPWSTRPDAHPTQDTYPPPKQDPRANEPRTRNLEANVEGSNLHRVFVGGLAWTIDDRELEATFAKYGAVGEARVIQDKQTGRSKGFGFVGFHDENAMKQAMEEMHNAEIQGRTVSVTLAQPKEAMPPRERSRNPPYAGGGGGGYGRRDDPMERGAGALKYRVELEGLPPNADWRMLKDFFRNQGSEVAYANVDRMDPSRGVVDFVTDGEKKRALDNLQGAEMEGARIGLHDAGTVEGGPVRRFGGGGPRDDRGGGYDRPPSRYDDRPRSGGGYDRPPRYGGYDDRDRGYGRGRYDDRGRGQGPPRERRGYDDGPRGGGPDRGPRGGYRSGPYDRAAPYRD